VNIFHICRIFPQNEEYLHIYTLCFADIDISICEDYVSVPDKGYFHIGRGVCLFITVLVVYFKIITIDISYQSVIKYP
jgi:hypothetical protein